MAVKEGALKSSKAKPKSRASVTSKVTKSLPSTTAEVKSEIQEAPVLTKQAGRPPLSADHIKASLTLRLKNVLWLDRLCADIREKTGGLMDRGSLLRGLVDAVQDSGVDLSHCYTEGQVFEILTNKLRAK